MAVAITKGNTRFSITAKVGLFAGRVLVLVATAGLLINAGLL
jgi:hypothetical protein